MSTAGAGLRVRGSRAAIRCQDWEPRTHSVAVERAMLNALPHLRCIDSRVAAGRSADVTRSNRAAARRRVAFATKSSRGSTVEQVTDNAAARRRILDLVANRTDAELARPIDRDWTVGALLAHLAFWDGVHVGRLQWAIRDGLAAPPPLPDGIADIVNNSNLPAWRAIPGGAAVHLFDEASARADAYIGSLDVSVIEGVRAAGYPRLVERFRHRTEHGDTIERALSATA